jgi:hypothetical protein
MRFKLYLRNVEKRITILKTLSLRKMLCRKRKDIGMKKVKENQKFKDVLTERSYRKNLKKW